jgi:hypothetical protein
MGAWRKLPGQLAESTGRVRSFACDVSGVGQVTATADAITAELLTGHVLNVDGGFAVLKAE